MNILILIGFLILLFVFLGHLLSKEDQLMGRADVAILFGALTPWKIQNRINKAVKLYKQGWVKKIIVTGGMNRVYKKLEAPLIREQLVKKGVENKDILLEPRATNYKENALFSLPLVKKTKAQSVVLISSSFEQLRCFLTTKKTFNSPKIKLINQPASSLPEWDKNTWFFHLSGWKWTWHTISRIIKYRLKGDL